MVQHSVDKTWVFEQLALVKAQVGVGQSVLELLEAWEKLDVEPGQIPAILETFSRLAQGHALVEETAYVWEQAVPGFVQQGDVVRVRDNAFSQAPNNAFNGRVGVAITIRSGDVIFRSTDDRLPAIDGSHFRPVHLETRVS